MRRGEAFQLTWTDIDLVSNTVRITPEKGSNPRVFKVSNQLAAMLRNLTQTSTKVFHYKNTNNLSRSFVRQRKRIAQKLGNPRLNQIHCHTFRHWKATMEYHKTKDILHVMQLLGHRKIENTLKYTQLVHFQDDDYVSNIAKNTEEARQLLEAGFEYVCTTPEEIMLFRKRK
jgi:integrase